MAFSIYLWFIPLGLAIMFGLWMLYRSIKRNWPPTDEEKSDLDIALEMEDRGHEKANDR